MDNSSIKQSSALPFGVKGVLLFLAFQVIRQSWRLLMAETIPGALAALLWLATIITPLIVGYGIMKQRPWGRLLGLLYFGWGAAFAIGALLLLFAKYNTTVTDPSFVIELCLNVLAWANLYRTRNLLEQSGSTSN